MAKRLLTLDRLQMEAAAFAKTESQHAEPQLFGVTDGKAVGTYFEQKLNVFTKPQSECVA
jgi:hypothetical protein